MDASVYVALLNKSETSHSQSWAWFQGMVESGETVYAPSIILPEVAAAISRGTGDENLAQEAVKQLKGSHIITIMPVTHKLATRAAAFALEHKIRGCDSVYVALAERMDGHLVTLDQQQLERDAGAIKTATP
jgi:predicted nucleic acid-binding protein